MVAGCCDLLTWSGACDTADASTALESFVARDRLAECLEWDRSLTPTMRAARCGDFCKFLSSAEASFDGSAGSFKKEMDAMGYDIWFWALVSGNKNILNFMRISTPLQRQDIIVFKLYGRPNSFHSFIQSVSESLIKLFICSNTEKNRRSTKAVCLNA